jgi:hypothetical protein
VEAPRKIKLAAMEPAHVLAVAAFVLGITAAAAASDAWWFFLGLMTFVLFFYDETP